MKRILLILLKPFLPHILRAQALAAVPDPEPPGPEYERAMAQALNARQRAEQIIARYSRT